MRPSRSALARATAVAVVLGALLVVGRLTGDSLRPPSPATTTTWQPLSVPPPPPTTPSPVTAHLRLGHITAVAVAGDAVWAAHGCAVLRVDPHTNRVVATIGLPPVRGGCWVVGMAADIGALWVSQSSERLLRVDPRSRRVVATLALVGVGAPVVTDVGVWAECCWTGINTAHPAGSVVRVDPASNRVVGRIRLPGLPTVVGAGPSGVWVTGAGGPIWRVDPGINRVVATIRVPGGLGGLPYEGPAGEAGDVLVGRDAVWVSNPASGQVLRIDPARNRLVRAMFVDAPSLVGESLVEAGGEVWATSGSTLLALGDRSRQVSLDEFGGQDEGEGAPVSDLAASPDAVWVGTAAGLFRVDLTRLG
jgi:DNA-binding beta-propeller fold protein YncE